MSQSPIPQLLRKPVVIRIPYTSHPNKNRMGQIKTDLTTRLQVLIQT